MRKNLFDIEAEVDERYSTKVGIPQYLPRAECPSIYDLCSTLKYETLIKEIEQANILPEQKEFLKLAASRHIVFNYAKIADYYAHQGEEMQKLMEKSALVIIDLDDAIANGFVKLSNNIEKIMYKTGRLPKTRTIDDIPNPFEKEENCNEG